MANLNTLTFASSNTYKNMLDKFGYVKDKDAAKLLVLDFLYELSTDTDYVYVYDSETQQFTIDLIRLQNLNNIIHNLTFCLMHTSCLINDSVTEVIIPEISGGGVTPPTDNPDVEFTFDGGISFHNATKIGVRHYQVEFAKIPTVMTCGWRFPSDYTLTDFQIYSNGNWVPEVYSGEDSVTDRWNVAIGMDDKKYFYWDEYNSQGRPGVIYNPVRYRFKLTT